jgi:hypothetical protein
MEKIGIWGRGNWQRFFENKFMGSVERTLIKYRRTSLP